MAQQIPIAPHMVRVEFQGAILPGVMAEVEQEIGAPRVTYKHAMDLDPLIRQKIRELYILGPGQHLRGINIFNNFVEYEAYMRVDEGRAGQGARYERVILPRRAGGRRKTRKGRGRKRSLTRRSRS